MNPEAAIDSIVYELQDISKSLSMSLDECKSMMMRFASTLEFVLRQSSLQEFYECRRHLLEVYGGSERALQSEDEAE